MRRREWLLLTIWTAGCRKPQPPDLFAEIVAGWRRTSLRTLTASEAPDPIPKETITRIQSASYEGPGKIEARLYELTSSGVALDLVQRWRPSPGTVFFYSRNYFVVVHWQDAERAALQQFVRAIEERLGPPPARPAP